MKHLKHFLSVGLGREKPETQTSEREQAKLAELAKGCETICEVGVFEGLNTALMAREMNENGVLFGVDPFFTGRLGLSYHKWITLLHLQRNLVRNRVKLIECLSQEVGDRVPEALDLVFIDGDHSLSGITADWSVYRKKVKVGGVIALHDSVFDGLNPKVQRMGSHEYYESHIKSDTDFQVIEEVDSLVVLKRLK